jgi:hypothetical protein
MLDSFCPVPKCLIIYRIYLIISFFLNEASRALVLRLKATNHNG